QNGGDFRIQIGDANTAQSSFGTVQIGQNNSEDPAGNYSDQNFFFGVNGTITGTANDAHHNFLVGKDNNLDTTITEIVQSYLVGATNSGAGASALFAVGRNNSLQPTSGSDLYAFASDSSFHDSINTSYFYGK